MGHLWAKPPSTREEARRLDRCTEHGGGYVLHYDPTENKWGVFGEKTSYLYEERDKEEDARDVAETMIKEDRAWHH